MGYGYFRINRKVLLFDIQKDLDKIVLHHYLIRKVNYQRLYKDLPDGQFRISCGIISKDLGMSRDKAYRLLNEFRKLNIIEPIKLGSNQKASSIYRYIFYNKKEKPSDIDINSYKTKDLSIKELLGIEFNY